nr:helix-turn-helix domain-containing protein [Leucobacter exalbidus]
MLAERQMTLTELSERVGVSIVNLSVLKNDRAKAIRFTTLTAICNALECEVGELLVMAP